MLRHHLAVTDMTSSSVSSPSPGKARRPAAANFFPSASSSASSSSATCCKHSSPSATLDLLILILVIFSCTFLISSSFAHIFRSLSQILPSLLQPLADSFHEAPLPYAAGLLVFLAASLVVAAEIPCGGGGGDGGGGRRGSWLRGWWWSRRCGNPRCRGLKKAMEFDVQLQTEESVRAAAAAPDAALWREIDGLPWKGGDQGNGPEYECLRVELRKMAPPNGRAVLLFRARCGCPLAKLEAWGPKRGRRHKKSASSLALEGGER